MSVKAIVGDMVREKCKLYEDHPDTVAGHIAHERAVANDYRGRVLYELLQNAVDRAEANVWIITDTDSRTLTVANDGKPFGAYPRKSEPRSDLAALCSIDTSNKKPGESIGNKGVGFKSVWEFCNAVSIRTRGETDDGNWGIRLRWPFKSEHLGQWEDSHSADLIRKTLKNSVLEKKFRGLAPSFYFPQFVSDPSWKEEGAVTAIELEGIGPEDFGRLLAGPLNELKSAPLEFVCDVRADGAPLKLIIKSGCDEVCKPLYTAFDRWIRIDIDTSSDAEKIADAMASLGFELNRLPKLVLAFYLPDEGEELATGKFHGYLPTEVNTGSPLHIQGDFYLSESRKHIDFQNNQYNELLLDLAVEGLFSSIISDSRVAKLPYIFQSLRGTGALSQAISKRLMGNGALLSQIIGAAVDSSIEYRKSYFTELYRLIGAYIPPKTDRYFYWEDYYRSAVDPYLDSFSSDRVKIVPTFLKTEGYEEDPLVTSACSLPAPIKNNASVSLFCRGKASSGIQGVSIDLPAIVVTDWHFPGHAELAETLKKRGVWAEYDATSVLRAIVRGQHVADSNELKNRFLRAARDVYSPSSEENSSADTNWRFLARDEVFPSQRLLVPVLPSGSWAQVSNSFLTTRFPDLATHLDLERVSQIDETACEDILGPDYLRTLKHWGVWDVVPLVSKGAIGQWQVPIEGDKLLPQSSALKLLSASYSVWVSSEYQRAGVEKVLKELADMPWLEVASGFQRFVQPSRSYLGLFQGDVRGFPVLESDSLSAPEKYFLDQLGVRAVEQTADLEKLIRTLEDIARNCAKGSNISGAIRSIYRQITKQINKLLIRSKYQVLASLLNRIPLLYEDNVSRQRGIAGPDDSVWYVSEALRAIRGKVGRDGHYWWLANGDLGTLANRLDRVHPLSLKSSISTTSEFFESQTVRSFLETSYLPYFLALACYGDLPGLAEVYESTIQKRWQTLVLLQGDQAQQDERIGTDQIEVQSTSTLLSEKLLFWEHLRPDSSRNLILYVWSKIDRSSRAFQYRLCDWFAEEVFRRPQLAFHFKQLVDSAMSPETVNLTKNAVADADELIRDWLPDSKVDALVDELSAITGVEFSKANWRDQTLLTGRALSFNEIIHQMSDGLSGYMNPLNPEFTNQSRLIDFICRHESNLAAIEKFGEFNEEDWVALFHEDSVRFRYDFEPLQWVLKMVELTEEHFNRLKGRLDGELRKSEHEAELIGLHVHGGPVSGLEPAPIKGSLQIPQLPGRISEAASEEDRIKEQVKNSRSGHLAEKMSVLHAAKRAAALETEEQEEVLSLVKGEYARIAKTYPQQIAKYTDLPEVPCTEEAWSEILHLAIRWDGLGYDYLDYERRGEKFRLLLVEVKSSRRDDPCIYLSENERLCVLKYTGGQFKAANPNVAWRLVLLTGEKMVDATQFVAQLVREHASAYKAVPSVMTAEGWIIRTR